MMSWDLKHLRLAHEGQTTNRVLAPLARGQWSSPLRIKAIWYASNTCGEYNGIVPVKEDKQREIMMSWAILLLSILLPWGQKYTFSPGCWGDLKELQENSKLHQFWRLHRVHRLLCLFITYIERKYVLVKWQGEDACSIVKYEDISSPCAKDIDWLSSKVQKEAPSGKGEGYRLQESGNPEGGAGVNAAAGGQLKQDRSEP